MQLPSNGIDSLISMSSDQYSAWNPGIISKIPEDYKFLETIYDPANCFSNLQNIDELARETGIKHEELVVFKPARLALHEVIIRITADIVVVEGEQEESLGVNFRKIADKILSDYIQPKLADIESCYEKMRASVKSQIEQEFSDSLFASIKPTATPKSFWSFLKPKPNKPATPVESLAEKEFGIVSSYREKGLIASDPQTSAIYRSLYRVLGAIISKRGFLGQDKSFLVELCTDHVCNSFGARSIGKIVHEIAIQTISDQGYQMIPEAEKAILISLKGTSAAGKSSLRPRLRQIMSELGMINGHYGTISPDIWRRLLLDYAPLGEAYKYAGRLTSYEVIIIDSKLDQYIRGKAQKRQSIPHLMVDRFRFDSFASEKVSRVLHKTYVKYIDTMYMYFVITPPEATVERGWTRGLARGRYKSVEDFLGHSVEAYAGIPKLLFKYLSSTQPKYIFEFLDNDVPIDHYPLLIAKGTQGMMDIYDPTGLVNIVRFQKINIMAQSADEVYAHKAMFSAEKNLEFLQQCIAKIEHVRFIDIETETVYLTFKNGRHQSSDQEMLNQKSTDSELKTIFERVVPDS
ncbi:MAG: hypothetical protein ACI9KN_000526 [Gammaproteobacteria bacterium]|jgi:hypothetical protein